MKKKPKRPLRSYIIWITSNLIIFAMILFFVFSFSIWHVQKLVVDGENYVTEDKILATAKISIGENMFGLDFDEIRDQFKGMVKIKKIKFHRSFFPNTVRIIVEERKPYTVVMLGSSPTLIDDEGYILARMDLSTSTYKLDISSYPVIRGITNKQLIKDEKGMRVNEEDRKLTKQSLDLLKKFITAGDIQIDISDRDDIQALLGDVLRVKFGSMDDLEKKIRILSALIEANKEKITQIVYVDLRLINDPIIKFK